MRVFNLLLLFLLLMQPTQVELNPIYRASNGEIGVGSWFYYKANFTAAENRTYNYTITRMTENEVTFNITTIYASGFIARSYKTVDLLDTYRIDFWIDIEKFSEQLRQMNGTTPTTEISVVTWIYSVNDTFIHYKVKTSSAFKDIFDEEIVVTNTYGVITSLWINKTVVTQSTTTIRISEQKLIDWKYQNIKSEENHQAPSNDLTFIAIGLIGVISVVSIALVIYRRKTKQE